MALKNFASNKTLLENQREELYQRYDKVAESVFTGGTCSYCGQALPEEQTNELREKFNLNKSQELESITQKGLSINAELENIDTSYKAIFKAKEENQKEFMGMATLLGYMSVVCYGFEDAKDGSWFGSYKVENSDVWAKVKSGEFQGFSVEGIFGYSDIVKKEDDIMIEKIKEILRSAGI